MQTVLLVAYLIIVLALIGVILIQRSEGGGLGMGGNAGGLMTVRGSANLLTRTTAVLAALFFATAIGLTILSSLDHGTDNILNQAASNGGSAPSTVLDALSQMQAGTSSAPASETTASSASTDPGLALPTTTAPSTSAASAPPSASASSEAPVASSAVVSSAPAPVSSAPEASAAAAISSAPPSSPAPASSAPAQ
ncbi:MAG: preprotein translocase subunit SecG [Devosia sp.]|jgi:preprotein translocase subunit SecG